jgi:predicted nuclease of predicted toxin-antitoxin system
VRLYLDDDSVDPGLIRLLRRDGHDVEIPADVGLVGSSDQVHLAHAIRQRRVILTRNYRDFEALHDLVAFAGNGHHAGILVVRFDSNPRNNMSAGGIARAVRNLENAAVAIADSYFELNHWQ